MLLHLLLCDPGMPTSLWGDWSSRVVSSTLLVADTCHSTLWKQTGAKKWAWHAKKFHTCLACASFLSLASLNFMDLPLICVVSQFTHIIELSKEIRITVTLAPFISVTSHVQFIHNNFNVSQLLCHCRNLLAAVITCIPSQVTPVVIANILCQK